MFILFGFSIEHGMTFIGPFNTEVEALAAEKELSFNSDYEKLANYYTNWSIITLVDLKTMNNGDYFDKSDAGSTYLSQVW